MKALFLAPLLIAAGAFAQDANKIDEKAGPSLTIYSSADPYGFDPQQYIEQARQGVPASNVPGFGVVKEIRSLNLKEGVNTLSFTDVAQFIDPTTVSFADLTAKAGTAVLEQRFQFDLVNPDKLLEKSIDSEVSVTVPAGEGKAETYTGKLMSINQGQLVLREKSGTVRILSRQGANIARTGNEVGLITRPTLQWLISSRTGGPHDIRTTYQTAGLTWKADYNLVLSDDERKADLSAWVTLLNLSGTTYQNAKLKLIAGDVQRAQNRQPQPVRMMARGGAAMADVAPGFEEKAFFEYHLYSLPRRTDITQNATQQLALFPTARDVGVEKVLVYYGQPQGAYWVFAQPYLERNLGNDSNKKVDIYFRFANTEANKMGMPLPRGKIRVYKQDDADKSLEFIGEDLIDHTPRNEKVLIRLGQAFDIVGERTQTNFTVDANGRVMTESFRIELRNAKKELPVHVVIKENLYRWTNWEIVKTTDEFAKIDARTIHFDVDVPADGKKVVEYTVKYTW